MSLAKVLRIVLVVLEIVFFFGVWLSFGSIGVGNFRIGRHF